MMLDSLPGEEIKSAWETIETVASFPSPPRWIEQFWAGQLTFLCLSVSLYEGILLNIGKLD